MCFWFYLGIRVKFEVGMNREWIVKMKIDWKWWKDVLCRNDLLARKGCYVESEYTNRKRIFVSFFRCRWFWYRVQIRVAMGWCQGGCWVEFCLFGLKFGFSWWLKLGKEVLFFVMYLKDILLFRSSEYVRIYFLAWEWCEDLTDEMKLCVWLGNLVVFQNVCHVFLCSWMLRSVLLCIGL